jgi:hypothetical protein
MLRYNPMVRWTGQRTEITVVHVGLKRSEQTGKVDIETMNMYGIKICRVSPFTPAELLNPLDKLFNCRLAANNK